MIFTTPAIASEPYIAEAPSLSTSTLSTIAEGIADKSGEEAAPEPIGWSLLPFNKIRVLAVPIPLRENLTVPSPPLLVLLFDTEP